METYEHDVTVGNSLTVALDLGTKAADAVKFTDTNISSATVLVYAEGEDTLGTVDSGSASTVVDAARTEVDDFWNGMTLEFTDDDNKGQKRPISDFTAADDTLTLTVTGAALPATPAAGNGYAIRGYPLIYQQNLATHDQGSVSGNVASFQLTSANGCTSVPRTVVVIIAASYPNGENTDVKTAQFRVKVVEA